MSLALHSTFTNVLASIPSPTVSYFDLGPIRIHFYALCIIAGIIAATFLTNHRLTKRGAEPWV
ncbi:MAG: prolipoprotein diacylglyceryl transferase, partial [Microbacterium sp.]